MTGAHKARHEDREHGDASGEYLALLRCAGAPTQIEIAREERRNRVVSGAEVAHQRGCDARHGQSNRPPASAREQRRIGLIGRLQIRKQDPRDQSGQHSRNGVVIFRYPQNTAPSRPSSDPLRRRRAAPAPDPSTSRSCQPGIRRGTCRARARRDAWRASPC